MHILIMSMLSCNTQRECTNTAADPYSATVESVVSNRRKATANDDEFFITRKNVKSICNIDRVQLCERERFN
jgi:hypothetical protein